MKIKEQIHVTLKKEPLSYKRIKEIANNTIKYVHTMMSIYIGRHLFSRIFSIYNKIHHNITVINLKSEKKCGGGEKVLFYLPDLKQGIQYEIFVKKNFFEISHLKIFEKYIDDNAVVADVGANIGNHTLYFTKKVGVKHVYSFEPIPSTFELLKKNISLNNIDSRVTLINAAVGKSSSNVKVDFTDPYDAGATQVKYSNEDDTDVMPCLSLDEYFKDKPALPTHLKIDVEGFELEVLKGAADIINKNQPIIFLETWKDKESVKSYLHKIGYKLSEYANGDDYVYVPDIKEK